MPCEPVYVAVKSALSATTVGHADPAQQKEHTAVVKSHAPGPGGKAEQVFTYEPLDTSM